MNEKNYLTQVPPKSFFEHCAFLCVDLQGGPHVDEHARNYVKEMPAQWREMGFSLADVNAAVDYYVDHCIPSAITATKACRAYGLPMIFIHWGSHFEDGIDIDPFSREELITRHEDGSVTCSCGLSVGDRPASYLDVQPGEYVLHKTSQDTFAGTPILFMLQNLNIQNLVLIGGHTGACLGRTSKSAKENGFRTLCVEDATNNAFESNRIAKMLECNYDYIITAQQLKECLAQSRE